MAYTLTYSYSNNAYAVTGYTGEPVDVVIPDTYDDGIHGEHPVTTIREYAFRACSSLTSVTIPNSVISIESLVFDLCGSLTSVTIGNSVTSIGNKCFSYCRSLTSVILVPSTPPNLGDNAFENINTNAKFYCYQQSENAYKTATNWNTYADKFVADDVRLYFIMNSISSKNYFAKKQEIDLTNFGTITTTTIVSGSFFRNNIAVSGGVSVGDTVFVQMSNGAVYPTINNNATQLVIFNGSDLHSLTITKVWKM